VIILGARFVPGARTAVNLTTGATGMPRGTFVLFSSVASLAWALYYVGIGMLGGLAFAQNPLLGVALGIGLALALGGMLELVRRLRNRRTAATAPRRAAAGTGRASAAGPGRVSRSDRAARGACPAPARGAT